MRVETAEANDCGGQAPEIQSMYSLGMPVSQLRTKMRQEFERHRYVNQIGVVDMLLFQSHAEYQVRTPCADGVGNWGSEWEM
jgi:NADH dehydrogenase (ubiquinone) 1 alpha subcomplex subunit 6